jgi:hypothetical protein
MLAAPLPNEKKQAAMTQRKSGAKPNTPSRKQAVHLKDEVYRQMMRLEVGRPGAEMGLAISLVRAWQAAGSQAESSEERDWLKKISPICLQMIETALNAYNIACPGAQ